MLLLIIYKMTVSITLNVFFTDVCQITKLKISNVNRWEIEKITYGVNNPKNDICMSGNNLDY
jgi:hypothetical protein